MECLRCGGSGKIKKFKHVENGNCFDCNGKGYTLKESEIMVVFLDGNKNELGRFFCTKETKQSEVRNKGKELGAVTMRLVKNK